MGGVSPCPCKQLPAPIYAALCLAENCIGPRSYRPDDIITMHSGKKSEIRNQKSEIRKRRGLVHFFHTILVHIILVHIILVHICNGSYHFGSYDL